MDVTIIADDLTGACDTGALFTGRGPVTVLIAPELPWPGLAVAALDTETRTLPAAGATAAMQRLASQLRSRLTGSAVFKKIDSTFRGPIAAELCTLLEHAGARAIVVCPAFPSLGRTVVQGLLSVHGMLAHESAVGVDPDYPGPTSDLVEILARHRGIPVSLLPLKEVRAAAEDLERALHESRGLVVADGETDDDLDALARASLAHPDVILAGSAGLARAAAAALGHAAPAPPVPAPGAWLVVAGSRHPATRAQIRALEGAGATGMRVERGREADLRGVVAVIREGRPAFIASGETAEESREQMAQRLAAAARDVLAQITPSLVLLTGGETALAVLQSLGARRLELDGAPAAGLALGRLLVDGKPSLPVLTKAGGFGSADLLVALARGVA
jgi:uncharacterized protein YgbK (DUF1537 family)